MCRTHLAESGGGGLVEEEEGARAQWRNQIPMSKISKSVLRGKGVERTCTRFWRSSEESLRVTRGCVCFAVAMGIISWKLNLLMVFLSVKLLRLAGWSVSDVRRNCDFSQEKGEKSVDVVKLIVLDVRFDSGCEVLP